MSPNTTGPELAAKPECAGFRTSGHWKGWRCGSVPKFEFNGSYYCKNHLPDSAVGARPINAAKLSPADNGASE